MAMTGRIDELPDAGMRRHSTSATTRSSSMSTAARPASDGVITVVFRVIASPHNARELFRQLGMSLIRYADTFGPIDDGDATPVREER